MQQYVREMGMKNTQFKNVTGWPDPEHYSSVETCILTKLLIERFPEPSLYKEKYFTTMKSVKGIVIVTLAR